MRYLHYVAAGDQYVGRVVSGLPLGTAFFALPPPHFTVVDSDLEQALVACFPYLHSQPDVFGDLRGVLTLCLASIVYHSDWLRSTLHDVPNHPVLQSWLFRHDMILTSLKSNVCCALSCKHIRRTGISPETNILISLLDVTLAVTNLSKVINDILPERMAERLTKVIEDEGVKAGNVTPNTISQLLTANMNDMMAQMTVKFREFTATWTNNQDQAAVSTLAGFSTSEVTMISVITLFSMTLLYLVPFIYVGNEHPDYRYPCSGSGLQTYLERSHCSQSARGVSPPSDYTV